MSSDIETLEEWVAMKDGTELFAKTWLPKGDRKAIVVHLHGFSEHCQTFNFLLTSLAARGVEVRSFDQRGWGRSVKSPRQRGLTGPTSLVLDDVTTFINRLLPAPVPVFLMGHSMGGAECLTYAAQGLSTVRKQLRGYLVFGPFIALHPRTKPFALTVMAGRLAAKALPHFQLRQPLEPDLLCTDKAVGERFIADPLCHDTGTLEGLAGMLDRGIVLEKGLKLKDDVRPSGNTGVWVAHGGDDQICDCKATEKWFAAHCDLQDKTLRVFDGAYHRVHEDLEPTKSAFAKEAGDWIMARLD